MAATKRATIFSNISELFTLSPAAAKAGRRVEERDLGLIPKALIVEQGGRIVWVGKKRAWTAKVRKSLGLGSNIREVDLGGRCIMPAFVECHTHSVFAGSRADEFEARVRGETYQDIAARGGGILSTVRATRKASEKQLAQWAQSRADVFLRQGVTTLEVKSGYGLDLANELKMLRAAGHIKGPRIVRTFLGAHAVPPGASNSDQYVEYLLAEVLPKIAKHQLADRVDIFIDRGYFSVKNGESLFRAAKALDLGITCHAEQMTLSGATALSLSVGAQSVDHVVQIGPEEISKLAASETTAVLLPAADLYLKMAYPPARKLLAAGARVALATDFNPGSCPTQDLSLVGLLARLEMKMTLPETIAAYTINAAWALGKEAHVGSLEREKHCDFIVLDDAFQSLFYSVGHHPVFQVWREGRLVFAKSKIS